MKLLMLSLILALSALAETYRWDAPSTRKAATRGLVASQAALLGATAADMATSYHNRYELNPLLRSSDGQFGNRGIVIKTGITAAWLGFQWIAHRRTHGNARVSISLAGMNGVMASVMGATAASNARGPTR